MQKKAEPEKTEKREELDGSETTDESVEEVSEEALAGVAGGVARGIPPELTPTAGDAGQLQNIGPYGKVKPVPAVFPKQRK